MTSPLVSIIINNYNYGCYISKAIDSALSQTYPYIEVIVVDDGSTDNSREIINSYKEQVISVFKQNGGQASAFNQGFAASKGDIICLLDSDDIFTPVKVVEVVKAFEEHQDIGWCFHHLYLVNISPSSYQSFDRLINQNSGFSVEKIDFQDNIKNAEMPQFVPATSGLCFSRSLLSQILPMPESEGVSISDLYVKYIALGLDKGCVINANLAIQGVHTNNAYTCKSNTKKQNLYSKIDVLTAYWMRLKFPLFNKMSNKLLSRGIGGGLQINCMGSQKKLIKDYLITVSLLEKAQIFVQVFYYYLKFMTSASKRKHEF